MPPNHDFESPGMQRLSRRVILCGAAALAGCGRSPVMKQGAKPAVSIVRAAYTQDIYPLVRRLLGDLKLDVRGKRVLLKPNLVEYSEGAPINTRPLVVHAVLEALLSLGAGSVLIGEGPGHRRDTLDLAEAAGYFDAIPKFEERFVDLNTDDVAEVKLRSNLSRLSSLFISRTAASCDLVISIPKMKTHHWVGATLSMKNFFGVVPGAVYGWPKNVLHWAGINESIVDLSHVFPATFAVVDGIEAMEGNGPIQGDSRHVGVLVAGGDLPAVDSTCCRVMGINPQKIPYLSLASLQGQTVELNVSQVGEKISEVQSSFKVLPDYRGILL
jgi:uncharacterized protein (DUF362 family)